MWRLLHLRSCPTTFLVHAIIILDALHHHPCIGLSSSSLGQLHRPPLTQKQPLQPQFMTSRRRRHQQQPQQHYPNDKIHLNYEARQEKENDPPLFSHPASSSSSLSWKYRRRKRSKAILNSFQDAERRQEKYGNFVHFLNTMVQDLLGDRKNYDDGNKVQWQQNSRSSGSTTTSQRNNLARHIHPKDASSIIRLLGRNRAHDAMLRLCRRYCRDILLCNSMPSSSSSTSNEVDESGDESPYFMSPSEVADSIRFAYTAAIAECAKPPKRRDRELPSVSEYRTKSFLLSLLNEMENGYSIATSLLTPKDYIPHDSLSSLLPLSILPNSYTLSAVLLGIDDVTEAMTVLEGFEEKYGKDPLGGINSEILTVQVYNVVIASCSKDSPSTRSSKRQNGSGWQRALSILQRMRRSGPQPDEDTFSMILQACAIHGQMKVALSLLHEIQTSLPASTGLYLPLLQACAKMGDHTKAKFIIDMMKNNSLGVTTEIMNLYLSSLAKHNKKMHTHAMKVLQEMIDGPSTIAPPPDIFSFNNVLAAYANAGDYHGAQSLLDDMKHGLFDVIPDVVSYNTVISCADPSSALFLIREMRLTRRHREGVIVPNSVTYVNAISQCRKACFQGDEDETQSAYEIAMHLLDLASEENYGKGVELNVFVYSASIWMAEVVGDYQSAVKLLREMKCHPNNVCYDGVISVLSKQGMHREALHFYYEMQKANLSASRKTYQMLVHAIDHSRDTELTSQKKAALLDGVLSLIPVEDRRVQVGGPLFEAIIRNHGNDTESGSSYQVARMTFDLIIGPVDDACLCAILGVCSSVKPTRWNEAITLIHSSDILSDAQVPGMVSRRALSHAVTACARADQWAEAINLLELYGRIDQDNRMKQSGSGIVTVAAINSVIRACGRKLRPDVAVKILNDMSKKFTVKPDEVTYRLAIIACNQAEHREMRKRGALTGPGLKWWECALSLLRRMKEDGVKPSLQTISSVVSACDAAGEWQRAIGVLKSMTHFSSLPGDAIDENGNHERPNLYCYNAAISACEKGGAWVEALQLFQDIRSIQSTTYSIKPNFVTVNSLLIALEKANQHELAGSIYRDSIREKILSPWKKRLDKDGNFKKMMDLHQFSAPMAKIAVRCFMETLLSSKTFDGSDAIFIVGKGNRSDDGPVLMPVILQLLREEYEVSATIDEQNSGRIRVTNETITYLIEKKRWKF